MYVLQLEESYHESLLTLTVTVPKYRHHPTDTFIGSLLGAVVGYYAYRFALSIHAPL
jgi:hypothetical protein